MKETIRNLVKDKKVLILGYGREGQSSFRMVSSVGGYACLDIADAMERLHEILAAPEGEEKSSKKGIDMEQYEDFMDVLIFLFRDFLVYKATGDDSHLIFSDKVSYIRSATENCTYEGIGSMIKDMEIAKNRVSSNVNIDLALELMLLGIKENL